MPARLPVEYVLPLRRTGDGGLDELAGYLAWLSRHLDVTVVDGSPEPLWTVHHGRFAPAVRHLRPDPGLTWSNGKVSGVTTGIRAARHEHVVVADDDVRYDEAALRTVHRMLAADDLVRPQNYFAPLPWHACWDTARSLLTRGVGAADFPGTFGVRRSTFVSMGGYDGDVLFENLELVRTVRAHGGTEASPAGLYVRRLPPTTRRFWEQRVRQAYDEFARPHRMALFLAVLPASVTAVAARRRGALVAAAAATVAVAERGRRRAGGVAAFPFAASLMAPLWTVERGACAWVALALRVLRGGVRYGGRRIAVAAHGERFLRRRRSPVPPARGGGTVTVTPHRDGPLLLRGEFRLRDPDGRVIDPRRRTVALCRCGASGRKPFCDGSHRRSGFRAPPGAG